MQRTLQVPSISARTAGQFAGLDSVALGDRHGSWHAWGMETDGGCGTCPGLWQRMLSSPILIPRTILNTHYQPKCPGSKSCSTPTVVVILHQQYFRAMLNNCFDLDSVYQYNENAAAFGKSVFPKCCQLDQRAAVEITVWQHAHLPACAIWVDAVWWLRASRISGQCSTLLSSPAGMPSPATTKCCPGTCPRSQRGWRCRPGASCLC